MNINKYYLLGFFCGFFLVATSYAQNKNSYSDALMTANDVNNNAVSNITLINGTSQTISASGLFIASFDINDCSACTGNIIGGDNLGGAVISPVTFKANQSIPIGQNYLYNMIYNGIYYTNNNSISPCALPGCSWPGDDPTVTGWCITINATALNASYTHSNYTNGSQLPANAPPYSQAGNSAPFDYRYDLINPSTLGGGAACLGPIVCNDSTQTCQVSTAQHETFQSY